MYKNILDYYSLIVGKIKMTYFDLHPHFDFIKRLTANAKFNSKYVRLTFAKKNQKNWDIFRALHYLTLHASVHELDELTTPFLPRSFLY